MTVGSKTCVLLLQPAAKWLAHGASDTGHFEDSDSASIQSQQKKHKKQQKQIPTG